MTKRQEIDARKLFKIPLTLKKMFVKVGCKLSFINMLSNAIGSLFT